MDVPLDRESYASHFQRAASRVGAVIAGKYRLEQLVGVGSMAAVYAAIHLRNTSRVAVKILHREFSSDEDLVSRFLREGYLANRVSHPATVHVLDDHVAEDGSLFLVMELIEGETLDRRWTRSGGKLDVGEVVALTSELLDVLAAAHARGIVHRDIKPENVSFTSTGQLKLLDFGIARDQEPSSARTVLGTVLGTPGFMPPEQALGRIAEVDALSDLWSVGATAFALLSGRLVHVGESASETLARAALMRAVPLSSVAPHVPPRLAQIVDRALAFEKARRWPSALAMREALADAFGAPVSTPLAEARRSVPPESAPVVPLVQRTQVMPAPQRTVPPAGVSSELALARTSWTPPPPVVVSAAEETRWRRDLRRSRVTPFLLAGLGLLALMGLAATAMVPDLASVWRTVAPQGLVSAASPARSSGSNTLPALPASDGRSASVQTWAPSRGDASPANARAKEPTYWPTGRPAPPPSTPAPESAAAATTPTGTGVILADAPSSEAGGQADAGEPDGAVLAARVTATWADQPRGATDPD